MVNWFEIDSLPLFLERGDSRLYELDATTKNIMFGCKKDI